MRIFRFLAMAALLAPLAACAVGGPMFETPKTQPGEIPRAEKVGFTATVIGPAVYGHDGAPLYLSTWRPEGAPRFVIVGVHGYGEYGDLSYGPAAPLWTERGAIMYAYDQRGFGRNPSRGAWPGKTALIADLGAVLAAAKAEHPDLPIALIGHSMGGGVSLAYLGAQVEPQPDAAVLLAPAVLGGEQLGAWPRFQAWFATAMDPDRRLQSSLSSNDLTDNAEVAAALDADPWYLQRGAPREYLGVIRLMDQAVADASNVTVPVLVVAGDKDRVIPEPAIRAAFERLPEPKTYLRDPEGWHLLMRDAVGPQVREDVSDWLANTLPLR